MQKIKNNEREQFFCSSLDGHRGVGGRERERVVNNWTDFFLIMVMIMTTQQLN